jgi:branched-chain amino acid aminotransferase
MPKNDGATKTWTYFEDKWHQGNLPIMSARTHAAWLCSVVFDGARAFEGVTPDLELHCARVNESAKKMFLKPTVPTENWVNLARDGVSRFQKNTALYIRPMYWAEREGPWVQGRGYRPMIPTLPAGVFASTRSPCDRQRTSR